MKTNENPIDLVIPKEDYDENMRMLKLNRWKKLYICDKEGNEERIILKNGELYEKRTDRLIKPMTDEEFLELKHHSAYAKFINERMTEDGMSQCEAIEVWHWMKELMQSVDEKEDNEVVHSVVGSPHIIAYLNKYLSDYAVSIPLPTA